MAKATTIVGKLPIPRGEYAEGEMYYKYNFVQHLGSTYMCIDDSTTTVPSVQDAATGEITVNSGWSVIADASAVKSLENRVNTSLSAHSEEIYNALKEYSDSYKDSFSSMSEDMDTMRTEISNAKNEITATKNEAVAAKDEAVIAKNDAITAKEGAVAAKDEAVIAKNDAITAKEGAVAAKDEAVIAKNDAITAKEGAVAAKDEAVIAKNDAITAKEGAVAARNEAEKYMQDALADVVAVSINQTTGDLIAHVGGDFSALEDAYIDSPTGNIVFNFNYS